MTNYIRGDLLLYTNKGVKRADKLLKTDIIHETNKYTTIHELNKNNVKNYSFLFKIKLIHNIDNYYLSGNNKIYCIQNIPYDLKMKDCPNFIEDNKRICTPSFINISDVTDFDYVGYPFYDDTNDTTDTNDTNNTTDTTDTNDTNDTNDDNYRFQGLILLEQYTFNLNNNLNKNTIGFLNKYLHNNNISNEIFNNNITTTIKINLDAKDKINILRHDELVNLSRKDTLHLMKGFMEINSVINTTDKNIFYLLKRLFMKIGVLITANYINNNYLIKIPTSLDNTTDNNYFIYDNYMWSKIKKIGKADKYVGHLYNIKMTNNSKYLTEIGVIS
jgi:hypothetical protein